MQLTIAKRDALRVITRMAGVAQARSTIPLLSHVLLSANGDTLSLSSTDLYLSLNATIQADVAKPGAVSVPAKDLLERVKNLPDGSVEMSVKDTSLVIKGKGTARKYTLRSASGDDFPPMPRVDETAPRLTIAPVTLTSLISLTGFSVSTDETRPHLNSALFEWDGDTVRMVSTDGHRLSLAERKVANAASASMLVPLKALHEIRRMAEDLTSSSKEEGGELTLVHSGPNAFVIGGGATFCVKLVDAQFPPYRQVIPKATDRIVRVSRAALLDALKAMSITASDRGGVKFVFSKGLLRLSSESADSGDGVDELPIEYSGPPMAIGFNARYVIDPLAALSCDEAELGLSGELDPMTVGPVGTDGFLGVCMPMRI